MEMNDNTIEYVIAVVVTYNRKDLLLECCTAVLKQSYSIKKLIIIDNASTDGTKELLEEKGLIGDHRVNYVGMELNIGGAGGFYCGIKEAMKEHCGWIWIMDDDTIPMYNCLEEMIIAKQRINTVVNANSPDISRNTAFLCSTVYGENHEFMNLPLLNDRLANNGYEYWYQYLQNGVVSVKRATFVSVLLNREAVKMCGLPCKDYFIWGDDSEYTLRLTKYYGDGYFVGKSVAIHKRKNAIALDIDKENNDDRIRKYMFFYRNNCINDIIYNQNRRSFVRELVKILVFTMKRFGKNKWLLKSYTYGKGIISAFLVCRRFKNTIREEFNRYYEAETAEE